MFSFRDYVPLIRDVVSEADRDDPNWKWSVRYIGSGIVRIYWGYLGYCQSNDKQCFKLEAMTFDDCPENPDILAIDEWGETKGIYTTRTGLFGCYTPEEAIKEAIGGLVSMAHRCY